jgi:hypothetical protein
MGNASAAARRRLDGPLSLANATAILAGDVEAACLGYEPLGEVHLCSACVPRLGNHLGVGNSAVEITVTVCVGAEQSACVLSCHHVSERVTLHLGQVPYQPQERRRRRLDGAPRESLGVRT